MNYNELYLIVMNINFPLPFWVLVYVYGVLLLSNNPGTGRFLASIFNVNFLIIKDGNMQTYVSTSSCGSLIG